MYVFNNARKRGSIPGEKQSNSPNHTPTSVPSPYHYNASPDDYLHDINLFKAKAAREAYKRHKHRRSRRLENNGASPDRNINKDEKNNKRHGKNRHSIQKLLLPDETEAAVDIHGADRMQQSIEQNWEVPPPADETEKERRPRPTSLLPENDHKTSLGQSREAFITRGSDSKAKSKSSSSTLQEIEDIKKLEETRSHSSKTSLQSKHSSVKGQQPITGPDTLQRYPSSQMSPSKEEVSSRSGRPTPTPSQATTTPSEMDFGMEWDEGYDYGMKYVPGSFFNMSNEYINLAGNGNEMETSFDWNMPESEALKVMTPKETTPTTPTHTWTNNLLLSKTAKSPLQMVTDTEENLSDSRSNMGTPSIADDIKKASQKTGDSSFILSTTDGASDSPRDAKSKVLTQQQINDLSKTPPPGGASPKLSAINLKP